MKDTEKRMTKEQYNELVLKYNVKYERDIVDRNKTYARERYRTFFYVFNNVEDAKNFELECAILEPYKWYDGFGVYSKEEVDKICTLREQGHEDKIRY